MFNLQQVKKVEVIEIRIFGELYQRQYSLETGATWFVGELNRWMPVNKSKRKALEIEWQETVNTCPEKEKHNVK
jgi:hypothetical protein